MKCPSNIDIANGNKIIIDNLNNKIFLDTLLQMLI